VLLKENYTRKEKKTVLSLKASFLWLTLGHLGLFIAKESKGRCDR